ncbi:MAG: protein kinase [Xanthomonadales bacterium]|jgi:tetratricopeptide (TPR) repeat protein|nr:protein kinase [Xanthomonadales bacterium]
MTEPSARKSPWERFRTGAALDGRLLEALMVEGNAGAVLPPGSRLGAWRLGEVLGCGGMSRVYRAERADGRYEQDVAIKVVRGDSALLERLRHERRLVAGLRHPHLVSLVDGGEAEDGALWFAMELVDGEPIDAHLQSHPHAWAAVLRLFDGVCEAVEYAHGRGLIHRDLKPDNILVDAHGHPRLLDFGIALTAEGDGQGDAVLTPGFASPEQLGGGAITIASDVYQLGLVLRRLLQVTNPPADAATVARAAAIPNRVRADLDRLLERALAADPADRYRSVSLLRADLACVLERRPLAIDQGNPRIRLLRFVERNRLAAGVGGVLLLALVVSIAVAGWRLNVERQLALAQAARAEAVSEFLVRTLGQANPFATRRSDVRVLEAMDQAATTLDDELSAAPDVRRVLRKAIADVYLQLDEPSRCLGLLEAPGRIAEFAAADATMRVETAILRSGCHLALDQRAAALAALDEADAALATLEGPSRDALRSYALIERAQILALGAGLTEANQLLEQALALAVATGSRRQEYRANRFLGGNIQAAGDHARALVHLQRAHELAVEVHGESHRSTLTMAGSLAISQERLGKIAEADATIERALAAAESVRLRGGNPDIVIAQLLDSHATMLWQQQRFDECRTQAGRSLAIYQRVAAPGSSQGFNPSWRVATCAYQAGDLDAAEQHARLALDFAQRGAPVGVVNALRMLTSIAAQSGRLAEAEDLLLRAEAAFASTEIANPTARLALDLAHVRTALAQGQSDRARERLVRVEEGIGRLTAPGAYPPWLRQEFEAVKALLPAS